MKFPPASRKRSMSASDSCSSQPQPGMPKVMAPMQISDTRRPLRPSVRMRIGPPYRRVHPRGSRWVFDSRGGFGISALMRLAKSYEPGAAEARWYAAWEEGGYFRPESARDPAARPFVMVIPPPNITGSLHMGHALNCTLQDILARYHRMNGRPTLWVPGTDHAGIATQVVVERQLGGAEARRAPGRRALARRVWEWRGDPPRPPPPPLPPPPPSRRPGRRRPPPPPPPPPPR